MYTDFASCYDVLMRDVPYDAWAEFYGFLLKTAHVCPGANVAECACGTGSITIPLKKMGYQMLGLDISGAMLGIAMQKAREKGYTIPFIQMDMSELNLARPVDAVLSTCDGINYLHPQRLTKFFQSVNKALKPQGALIFDLSSPYKMTHLLGNNTITRQEDDFAYIWHNQLADDHVLLHVDSFILSGSGYRRIEEKQTMFIHTRESLLSALSLSGFSDIRFYGDRTCREPGPEDERWHVLAKKD